MGTPIRIIRRARMATACALLLVTAWSVPAAASVLYRCVGPHGELAYVSHTAGYKQCTRIGSWPDAAAHPVKASRQRTTPAQAAPAKSVPGTPPKPVKANPDVLSVTPLGKGDSIEVRKLERPPPVWQPLPVEILHLLGGQVLPQLLGTRVQPAAPPAPAVSKEPAPLPAAQAIPLKLETAAAAPKRPRTGAVYRVTRKDGTVLYTNVASLARGTAVTKLFTYIIQCYACDVHSKVDWSTVPLRLADFANDIHAAAKLSGVNAALLRAVIHAESGFNPRALSYKGAQGLMQLMPGTASELGVDDAFNPAQNISGGARYLAMLLRRYDGNIRLAAAAYNAGAGAVDKYRGVPPYAETQVYVKRVALLYQRYSRALADRDGATTATALATTGMH